MPTDTWADFWATDDPQPGAPFNACWVINAPWAHPLWPQYALCLYDLTTDLGEDNAPVVHQAGATHEFMLFALDPDAPQKRGERPAKLQRLEPANLGFQFKADSDQVAVERLQGVVDRIVAGKVSPDTDFRSMWNEYLFSDAYPLHRA